MNYMEYYNKIDLSNKYTSDEKKVIKNILMSLDGNKISNDLKSRYLGQLKSILLSIDILNDKYMDSNIIRPGYVRRLQVLLDEISKNITLPNDDVKDVIQKSVLEFTNGYDDIFKDLNELNNKLDTYTNNIDILKLKNDIDSIDNKFITLFDNTGKKVNELICQINKFKEEYGAMCFPQDALSVDKKFNDLKNIIKEIKLKYIEKYNSIVNVVNNKIQNLTDIDREKSSKLKEIKTFPIYTVSRTFAFNNKLKNIKSVKVISVIKEIEKIHNLIDDNSDVLVMDNQINKLENAINNLYHEIENKEIIMDKESRKKINLIIDKCEKELDVYEKKLALYEKNKLGYNTLKSKLDNVQQKLIDTSIIYRSKCPLLVKKVKSAKDVYNKNDKLPLMALGLSSLSLIDFVVGPVIIPAVMCGNMKLANKYPKFNKVIKGVNKVLARVIDAKEYKEGYKLHTGVELNEEVASVSVLKSIAIHEGREWVVPLVYNARNLFEKMKLSKLKENISKGINSTSNKIKTSAKNIKEVVKDNVKIKDTLVEISRMFKEFQQSRLSMNEFCKRNNISIDDRIMLETFNKRVMG